MPRPLKRPNWSNSKSKNFIFKNLRYAKILPCFLAFFINFGFISLCNKIIVYTSWAFQFFESVSSFFSTSFTFFFQGFFKVATHFVFRVGGVTIYTSSSPISFVAFFVKLLSPMSIINKGGRETCMSSMRRLKKNWEPLCYLHDLVKEFERAGKHEFEHFDIFALPHTLH